MNGSLKKIVNHPPLPIEKNTGFQPYLPKRSPATTMGSQMLLTYHSHTYSDKQCLSVLSSCSKFSKAVEEAHWM